jgi:hypothetical protein
MVTLTILGCMLALALAWPVWFYVTHRPSAAARGYAASAEKSIEIGPAPATADFSLQRGARLKGTVIDRASKKPIELAKITLEGNLALTTGSSASEVRPSAITDESGAFELSGLPSGRVSLTTAATGHHGRIFGPQTAPESGELRPVTIELTPTTGDEEPRLELAGIGAVLAPKGDVLEIGQVVQGGGALAAGIVAGDAVLAVDGKLVKDLGFEGTVSAIRGPEGSTVVLTIQRPTGTIDVTVTRVLVRA